MEQVKRPQHVTLPMQPGQHLVSFSQAGTYVLRLSANDTLLSTTDDITVTVNPAPPVNQRPVVNAGPDQTITLPSSATLAAATDDGLPNPPGALTLNGAS